MDRPRMIIWGGTGVAVVALAVVVFLQREPAPARAASEARDRATHDLAEWLADLERDAKAERDLPPEPPPARPRRNPFTQGGRSTTWIGAPSTTATVAPVPDDESEKVQNWRQQATRAARNVELDSIVNGAVPLVVIRGSIVRLGDAFDADGIFFRVTEIGDRHAIVVAEAPHLGLTEDRGNAHHVRLELDPNR